MPQDRSQGELKRLVERAVADVCDLPRPGLWFCVDAIEVRGHPPESLKVWATLHFLPEGSPFCCGQPGCHLGLNSEEQVEEASEQVRQTLRLSPGFIVDFGDRIGVQYHAGVAFHYGRTNP